MSARLIFQCNICGQEAEAKVSELGREIPSCRSCGSTVRWRWITHLLSLELYGASLILPEFPVRPDIQGVGMTDWEVFAQLLAQKMGYTNTYYHQEPLLDITKIAPEQEGRFDFVITSEVFEHVPPPISTAFLNLRKLLKPEGVAIFTAPYGNEGDTEEHYPDLFDYEIEQGQEGYRIINRSREGAEQVFNDLVFHGGPGSTLEMRQFSLSGLTEEFQKAGFSQVTVHRAPYLDYGIYMPEDWSLPITARA
jgi:SAM-dependent methyltransferase